MSEMLPTNPEEAGKDSYSLRPEYDPERVSSQVTGLFEMIADDADYLLADAQYPRQAGGDVPKLVYNSEQRMLSCSLTRFGYESSVRGSGNLPIKIEMEITYQNVQGALALDRYIIEIKKTQTEALSEPYVISELYEIEKYQDSERITAEVVHPDASINSYDSSPMTPYDEENLHNELAIMAAYVQAGEDYSLDG